MSEDGRRSLPALIRHGVVFELRLYRSLLRWVAHRPAIPGPDLDVFGYAKLVTPVMWLWIFASAVEILVVDLLLPWQIARVIALVIGAWGLVWMVGLLASLKVYPHLLSDSALRVRHGASVDISIGWEDVHTISAQRRDLPSSVWTLQPRETASGTDLQVGVSGQVNVHAVLRRPVIVQTPKGACTITALSFLADDPRALVACARAAMLRGVADPRGGS